MNTQYLQALDLAETGDWDGAHRVAQALDDPTAAWIHANLHREEGDLANANYWYRRASKTYPDTSIADERATIRAALQ
ncbi:MAG: hypothetical protein HN919_01070 [Verrucomicrobia bacterium]|jgi:hypothetical protein|nr:hypothetical protein [Verrucomicrobiota bacterium]MBT7064868.1 hypothetical protein [Verrucomicrobiota bacterium]MBT7699842.1 hypothetical protein [Verrucomicrobiota bacterium]